LNPKHKIFEKCAEHFKTDDNLVARYKESAFMSSVGECTVKTLQGASIA
jgi:tyrosyl-tRNA synthetase